MVRSDSFDAYDDDIDYDMDDAGRDERDGDDDDYRSAEEDFDDDALDEPTIPCPYCRQEIHEDSQRCPYCERYISSEDAPAQRKPWWILIGIVAGLYAILQWYF